MLEVKAGLIVPVLIASDDSVAKLETRVTTTVYVEVVVPSSAVPTTVIVLLPTLREMLWLAVPGMTRVPLTRTVEKELLVLGVTVIADMALATLAV